MDRAIGEVRQAYIFVAVLGASNYTYAEANWAQDLYWWIGSHCRAFKYFGGVTQIIVPDNLKAGVSHPSRYEPDINPSYHEMATHYGTVVIPARPKKPRDKSKVEVGVQIVERWILAVLRHRTFFSLAELNEAIWKALEKLNDKPFKKLSGCRRMLFETVDKPALKPLPATPYEFARWKKARVNIDYHVAVDNSYYSVPYQLVRREVDIRITATAVEVFHKGQRVASHLRSSTKGNYSTNTRHMPEAHQKHLEWSPLRMIAWAQSIGPSTAKLIETILESKAHPEIGYRSCLGIIRLAKYYTPDRMELAASRALNYHATSYRSVKSILEKGLDRIPVNKDDFTPVTDHSNLRGPAYFKEQGGDAPC